ncbi:MAG: ABC transporter substrate-binding protein [Acetobacteraceae bacterium]|nr:ABC transporter substrate-binding protein [Acetobacteraceae bacterium]
MKLIAASICALALAASPGRAADPVVARAPDPVIGVLYPSTGPGAAARQAVAVAVDIVNATHDPIPVLMGSGGGLPRLGGAKLSVVYADDGGDPAHAAAAAEQLLAAGAVALAGGSSEANTAAISRVAEARGLPFLSLDGALPNPDGLTWFFRIARTPELEARDLLRQIAAIATAHGRDLKTVALLFDATPAGRADSEPVRRAAEAEDVRLVDAPIPEGRAVPPSIIDALRTASPDAILSERTDAALDAPLAAAGLAPLVRLAPDAPGPAADGVFHALAFTLDPLPARPGVSVVDSAFKARTGHSLDAGTAREITGILLLANVIDRAGSTKPADLRIALMATDTPGDQTLMLWNGIRFDASGQNVLASSGLQQDQGGKRPIVAPDSIAVAAPLWPGPHP